MPTLARSLVRPAALVVLAVLPAFAPIAEAQSIWLDRVDAKSIHVEIAKPFIEGPGDGFFTTSWFVSGRLRLSERLSFVGEFPFATFKLDSSFPPGSSETSKMIGNPYVGIESPPPAGGGGWFEIGVRAPLANEDEPAALTGIATDTERWEAFLPNVFVARLAGHWRSDVVGTPGVDLRVAPTLWVSDDLLDEVELWTTYGAQVLYHGTAARVGAGLSGRLLVTEEGDFADRSTHQFEAAGDFLAGKVRPGATLRIPLDDSFADVVVGVTLNFLFD